MTKDVTPALAEVASLIDSFEKAAAPHVKQKIEIDTRLKAALKP